MTDEIDWNALSAIGSAGAALLAALAAGLSFCAMKSQEKTAARARVADRMQAYLGQYIEENTIDAFTAKSYVEMSNHERNKIQIVAGLLVMLLDAMYEAKDTRRNKWATYLRELPGPLTFLDGFDLTVYAETDFATQAILNARRCQGLPTWSSSPAAVRRPLSQISSVDEVTKEGGQPTA